MYKTAFKMLKQYHGLFKKFVFPNFSWSIHKYFVPNIIFTNIILLATRSDFYFWKIWYLVTLNQNKPSKTSPSSSLSCFHGHLRGFWEIISYDDLRFFQYYFSLSFFFLFSFFFFFAKRIIARKSKLFLLKRNVVGMICQRVP